MAVVVKLADPCLQGKGVNKAIAYADREPLFPWRPKYGTAAAVHCAK